MLVILNHLLLMLLLLANQSCFAYTQDENAQSLESIYEDALIDNELQPEFDILEYFIENRICLNTTNANTLSQLPGITYHTALRIIDIVQNNVLNTYTEIFDSLRLSDEEKYVLRKSTYLLRDIGSDESQFYFRLRNKSNFKKVKGFKENIYEGNTIDYFSRLNYTSKNISAGVLTAKDAGENYLNDFLSGYILLNFSGIKVVLGDYYIQSGMGNILWNNFGYRKGSETVYPALQYSNRIVSYSTNYESNFMRGGAVHYALEPLNLNIMGWVSYNYISGNIDRVDNTCTSVYTTGYFRTNSEIEKRGKINEKVFGGSLEWSIESISIGSSGIFIQYNLPIKTNSSSVFYGKRGFLGTVFSRGKFDNITAIAEMSFDNNNNLALKSAFGFQTPEFETVFLYRYYQPRFRSPFGYNFGENSYISNESGLYTGLKWKPSGIYSISAYTDIYKTIAGTYFIPTPLRGMDLLAELDFNISSKTKTKLRLRYKNKTDAFNDFSKIIIYQKSKTSFRIDNNHQATDRINLGFRFEAANIVFENLKKDEFGISGFGEITWSLLDILEIGSRVNIYSTDSYESSIWQFEYTAPGFMKIQPLYGEGIRMYIFAVFKPMTNLRLNVKYSSKSINNVDFIGSGYDEIMGNTSRDLIIQLDYKM